jgi:hypothetical protein
VQDPGFEELGQAVDREIRRRFPGGSVHRAVLLRHGDDPAVGPGELLLRVYLPPPDAPGGYEQALAGWQDTHQARLAELRRELSLRLPSARLLEITFEPAGPGTPKLVLADDAALTASRPSPREIVTTALALLRSHYVFPDRAERAAAIVEAKLAAGDYDGLDEFTLASRLTADLYEVCEDKHLKVRLGGGPGPGRDGPGHPGPAPAAGPNGQDKGEPADHEERVLAMRRRGRLDNFGIHRVERLPGNVGYLDIRRVPAPEFAGPAISAAMELVAGTYALIIDLRRNGGGSPDGVVLWCSHLLRDSKTHLNDIFDADTGETRQFWSLGHLQAPRYLDRPVYALTSDRTFSGGEDFCYTLQALGRGVVIGETTGGGAHPTRGYPVSDAIHIGIPHARSINPVTGTNWEGTGVAPDVAVPQEQARDVAYRRALQHVLTIDAPPPIAEEAREALHSLPPDPPA